MRGKPKRKKKRLEGAVCYEPTENLFLDDIIFGEICKKDLKDISEHEIIVKISEILGSCPSNIQKAEEIFNKLKFSIANHVIHHEYKSSKGVNADLILWLDSKSNPVQAEKLSEFISKYLKNYP